MDIQINSNIDNIKPKVLGPFTGTQLICITIAIAIEMGGVVLINMFFPNSMVTYIIPAPIAIIPLALGWAEDILHMRLNDFWTLMVKRKMTHPSFRPYRIHNYLETLEAEALLEIKTEKEKEEKANPGPKQKKGKKQRPDNNIPPEFIRYN